MYAQLHIIFAVAQLREATGNSFTVGVVGAMNAGKTTCIRALQGLPPLDGAHRPEFSTLLPEPIAMPVTPMAETAASQRLRVVNGSPLLIDTPGMFDTKLQSQVGADQMLADYSLRYLGKAFCLSVCADCAVRIVLELVLADWLTLHDARQDHYRLADTT